MKTRFLLAAAVAALAAPASAAIQVVSFEGMTAAGVISTPYTEAGVTLTHLVNHYDVNNDPLNASDGTWSISIHNGNGGNAVRFTFGSAVDVLSFTVTSVYDRTGDETLTIHTSAQASAMVIPNGVDVGVLSFAGLTAFEGVTYMDLVLPTPTAVCSANCGGFYLDALTFDDAPSITSDVPLPAAAPLALLGFGALALAGRSRRG
ncbi:PEP-CTERM sorting domain-containing protein [Rhodovulum sp. DZ06]|uniref:PEP-CTERM sorting domain-containing protein n=1 Tax=Rhodovulum sp. DZ06 TaxID=3425126 RepID=UPI003D3322E3